VLIDTTYAQRAPNSGTAVYLRELDKGLRALPNVELHAVANDARRAPAGGGLGSVRNLVVDARWTEVELPRIARRLNADVIHHPLPAHSHATNAAQVVTIHDLAFERLPECFARGYRTYAHHAHRHAARHADACICVSETTACDVRELWGVERVAVARHGPGQAFVAYPDDRAGAHFLYVGDDEPRKDLATLRRAHELYGGEVPLMLARGVSAARLQELYADAVALVHPSRYEGFGLTLLEAMAAGVPVIAARAPGVTEVCGDVALYFPPGDAEALAAALAAVGPQPGGPARAAEFSWDASAKAHADAYSLAMERKR
jgi:glycosyltransferase involved in cell wall biosynthesis